MFKSVPQLAAFNSTNSFGNLLSRVRLEGIIKPEHPSDARFPDSIRAISSVLPVDFNDRRFVLLAKEFGVIWDSLAISDRASLGFPNPFCEAGIVSDVFSLRKANTFGLGQFFPAIFDDYRYGARATILSKTNGHHTDISKAMAIIKMTTKDVVYSDKGVRFIDCTGREVVIPDLGLEIENRRLSLLSNLPPVMAILAVAVSDQW